MTYCYIVELRRWFWLQSVAVAMWGTGMIRKVFGMALLLVGVSKFANACGPLTTPELDSATGVSALVLLSGALLIIRARRRK
jgi:hypothetical protein